MTMSEPLRLIFASDLHLGIRSIDQKEMADAFADAFFPILPETDIMFLNGDFFDTLVLFDNYGFDPVYEVIMGLFRLCDMHNVTLRVLQGTFTHDRKQCERFITFYKNNKFTFDFKFMGTIELEEITRGDRSIRVMYVPDDLPFKSSDEIVSVIKDRMVERGWDELDYGCMHGFFDFTYPKAISQENCIVFRESQFPFIKKMIDVGHVHQHRISGKVVSNGSFDRLNHGDEDPKGYVKVLDYPDKYKAQFIENKNSAIFSTLYFKDNPDTDIIRTKIIEYLSSITTYRTISLRIVIESSELGKAIKAWLGEHYPKVKCTIKTEVDSKSQNFSLMSSVVVTKKERLVAPTPKTIASFIRVHIPEDYDLTIEKIDEYLSTPPT
jgi:DNA repair exonuclease SbcCD nuclease subunit